jgi:hypothetical protein
VTSVLKRVIFWDFPRASWQYDVIVVGILAFIFLTPREIFKDQPKAQSIVLVQTDTPGVEVFFLEPMLERRDGKKLQLYKLTPLLDAEKETTGFMAYTRLVK